MNVELRPWRTVPLGATVFSPDGRPFEAGQWLGPDLTDPRRGWRVVGAGPMLIELDAPVPVLAGPEGAVVSMFRSAGFTIEGMLACPPDG